MKLISELILLTSVPVVQDLFFSTEIKVIVWKIEKSIIIIINPQSTSEVLSKTNK